MNKITLLFLLIVTCNSYTQNGLPFNSNKTIYLKGDSALIGNNILSVDEEKPFNENTFNDLLKLQYIDIDDDKRTFSSSKAVLSINKNSPKIKYAALYWSAIYTHDIGYSKVIRLKEHNKHVKKVIFKGNNERSEHVNTILFKTPNSNYKTIEGNIIFDSFNNETSFTDTKPYVCFADVTSILQNSKNVNGAYTVANIKATEGNVSGGGAGGWLLYVVYENEDANLKYFTTYNGFKSVYKQSLDLDFKDFKASESEDTKTALLLGAIEGDQKFKTDHCSFFDYKSNTYVRLFNAIRPKLNFFNSSISINETPYTKRLPNSKNTLGFDVLKIKIPNTNYSLVSNKMSDTKVRLNTKADRFYLFFVAFETEINPNYLKNKTPHIEKGSGEINTTDNEEILEDIINSKSITIPNLTKGYYLVTNVFSVKNNATKWIKFLEEKGYAPKSYVNPENSLTSIYLKTDTDPNVIYKEHRELSKFDYFEKIWIKKINF